MWPCIIGELAAHLGDHHVTGDEADVGMGRVYLPGHFLVLPFLVSIYVDFSPFVC